MPPCSSLAVVIAITTVETVISCLSCFLLSLSLYIYMYMYVYDLLSLSPYPFASLSSLEIYNSKLLAVRVTSVHTPSVQYCCLVECVGNIGTIYHIIYIEK